MSRNFTKLYLGDVVASGTTRHWRKLTTESQLEAPIISLDGDTLTITQDSGLATSFDILANGEPKYTYAKYLYNGVLLPPIQSLSGYPYLIIAKTAGGAFRIYGSVLPIYKFTDSDGYERIYIAGPRVRVTLDKTTGEWGTPEKATTNTNLVLSEGTSYTQWFVVWSSHDIPNGSATATDIYFESTEPVQSNASLTSATVDLSTLNLVNGTYSITCKARLNGKESAESNAVEYTHDSIVGTWVFNDRLSITSTDRNIAYIIFECNGVAYTYFEWQYLSGTGYSYSRAYFGAPLVSTRVYKDEWLDDVYKTINIISVTETNETFETWLKANATKQ